MQATPEYEHLSAIAKVRRRRLSVVGRCGTRFSRFGINDLKSYSTHFCIPRYAPLQAAMAALALKWNGFVTSRRPSRSLVASACADNGSCPGTGARPCLHVNEHIWVPLDDQVSFIDAFSAARGRTPAANPRRDFVTATPKLDQPSA